ncbi:trigger factor [Oceanithermus sp.]|uniref:trigger factor n=1 Tax=Oceanithermus sp. TaxID=2268145 RepID=UPI00257FB08F|nr:trigger factor [Oceanithermus sp.]
MDVTVEQTGALERRMTVEVPAERIEQAVEERLKGLARRVRVPGFRPGKVPFRIVRQRYGAQVRDEVLGEVMEETLREALAREGLRPAGGPRIEDARAEPGEPLRYTAVFEVYPEIELKEISRLRVRRPVAEVTEADVDAMIERLREQRATWERVERPAREGDRVILDYEAEAADGGEIPGGNRAEGQEEVLGSGRLLDEIDQALRGAAAGETREVKVRFPEDHRNEALRGREVTFRVTVREVAEKRLPEVNEAFARAFGIEEGGVEALRREVRANMERELHEALRRRTRRRVMDALLEANPVELPAGLVAQEVAYLREDLERRLASLGQLQGSLKELPDEHFEPEARRRVALGLILAELVRSQGLKADPDKVRAAVERIASAYEKPEEVVQWYYANRPLLEGVESSVLEDEAVDWVLAHAQVEDERLGFEEAVRDDTAKTA